ncbi:MAG: hypothetical protein JXA00_06365 [Candidatus Thermoplasmatota archaeon]|nr:hypothetical protein [Candidatus Thermoplasmatota archaeon]
MNQIPINEDKNTTVNKKAITLIIALVICGVVTGLILSSVFVIEANVRIEHFSGEFRPGEPPIMNFTMESLTASEIILPTLGVCIVCISMFLLIGLIAVYFKIFLKTSSKYVVGLLFFLVPLLIQSIFSVNTVRSLFVSSAIPFGHIRESIGFGVGGLGLILILVSFFEIIGLTILLYLSSE